MSQIDEVRARHELELQNAGLEDELAALKASGDDPTRFREVKNELRELRRYWREIRAAVGAPPGDGDAAVSPATIEAAASVQEV
jgi:hypothetical protein